MTHPAYETSPAPGDTEDIYLIHTSLTCTMDTQVALNEADALGKWLSAHNVESGRIQGRIRTEPYYHLEAEISGMHIAHVVQERVLEARRAGR